MLSKYKKYVIICIFFIIALSIFSASIGYWFQHPQNNSKTVVLIEKRSSLSQISSRLYEDQVLDYPFLFKAILICTGEWRKLKAGEYLIPPQVTPGQLIHILKSGNVILHPVTLIEGETSHHLTQKLMSDDRFKGGCLVPPEGSLLPETYYFPRGTERKVILHHMQKAMKSAVEKVWATRSKDHQLKTPEELVILASIVEKETALPRERTVVAAVFLNRLNINMMLQADPTVLYALTKGMESQKRELSLEDLKVDSPYNTYLHGGLPPSPIANPGLSSLKAAMNPSKDSYLYFVADGSGGHVFATTLEEHQMNHAAWRRIRDGR